MCNLAGIFVPGVNASNVECMYTSACGHIVHCSGFV